MDTREQLTPRALKALLEEFLVQKRAVGYKYSAPEHNLKKFIDFVGGCPQPEALLTKEAVLKYCQRRPSETPKTHSNRVTDLRQFIAFLNANGFSAYMPKPPRKQQSKYLPYVFTHEEMSAIIAAADSLKKQSRYNCAEVYPVLFRVLYGCGLRISEALNLRVIDVDTKKLTLTIRESKFKKSRIVLMSDSLGCVVSRFIKQHFLLSADSDFLFKNRDGSRRSPDTVYDCFRELIWKCGIPFRGRGYGPRLHDVRHTFCCHSLKKMSDEGIDMYCALPVLSAYVGHSCISSTERYLRLTEEFYPDVRRRMRATAQHVYPEVYMHEAD